MRMIPIGPFVWWDETVGFGVGRFDQLLRQHRHPIHLVFQPDAVPMHSGAFLKAILDSNAHPFPTQHPKFWTWH